VTGSKAAIKEVSQVDGVAFALADFLTVVDVDEGVMKPVLHERLSGSTLTLGDLGVVVGVLEVFTASMNIDLLAERSNRHR
jgi:hypothetical protein